MQPIKTQLHKLWRSVSRFFYWTGLYIRSFLFPLYKIPFIIVILLLGNYAFVGNDQGQDLMASFTLVRIFHDTYLTVFILFLFFWAVSIWNVSRILLAAANLKKLVEFQIPHETLAEKGIDHIIQKEKWVVVNIDPHFRERVEKMIKWAPRLLGLFPYWIFIHAYWKQNKLVESPSYQIIWVVIVIAVLHFLYMIFRKTLAKKLDNMMAAMFHREPKVEQEAKVKDAYSADEIPNFIVALKKGGVVINSVLTFFITVFMFGYAVKAAFEMPAVNGKPGLIVLTGFTVYTMLSLFFNFLLNRLRIPVFLLLVLFAVFVAANYNNNHTIQTLHSESDKQMMITRNMLPDTAYFEYWINKKLTDHTLDTSQQKNETIYLVAAEGGGIRNCYWTYRVLSQLQAANPDFYNKTFAVTGVSGGSIGLGFYYNYKYYFDSILKIGNNENLFNQKLDSICSSDYLSRVTYAFLFPDFLQRFIPSRIDKWDRSKYLANSFDDSFSGHLTDSNERLLSNNYLSMWADTNNAYQHPVILFNTIFNEDGTKAIFSPYRLSDKYYAGAMDLLFESDRSVPMREAMASSARFPVLTAPGLVWHDTVRAVKPPDTTIYLDSVKLGHISDGGGFENTGIQTIEQTALLILDGLIRKRLDKKINIQILYIGTGADSIELVNKIPADAKKHSDPLGRSYELAWLNGGANTIFGWIKSSHNLAVRLNSKLSVLQFGLKTQEEKGSHKLPLGWYLSPQSKSILRNQSTYKNASNNFKTSMDAFKKTIIKKDHG